MLSERRRKEIASLSRKKYRRQLGQAIVEGVRAVEAALAGGAKVLDLILSDTATTDPDLLRLADAGRRAGSEVHAVDERTMRRLTDVDSPQPMLAVVRTRFASMDATRRHERILALDAVQDPGNVGTLLRTAAWFGIGGVLLGPGTADVFSPKVVRATMGALWELDMVEADDLAHVIAGLRNGGYTVYGADLDGLSTRHWDPAPQSVLVLGSEAHGLGADTRRHLDATIAIPGAVRTASTESLNVATAGAVLMYEWTG